MINTAQLKCMSKFSSKAMRSEFYKHLRWTRQNKQYWSRKDVQVNRPTSIRRFNELTSYGDMD